MATVAAHHHRTALRCACCKAVAETFGGQKTGLFRGHARTRPAGDARSRSHAVASAARTEEPTGHGRSLCAGRPARRVVRLRRRESGELLGEVGYAALSVDAIARQAGTSKPTIYRRWPSKAHLVHEAVFPAGIATELPDTGSLAGEYSFR